MSISNVDYLERQGYVFENNTDEKTVFLNTLVKATKGNFEYWFFFIKVKVLLDKNEITLESVNSVNEKSDHFVKVEVKSHLPKEILCDQMAAVLKCNYPETSKVSFKAGCERLLYHPNLNIKTASIKHKAGTITKATMAKIKHINAE